jgi:hypothetical protein
MAPIAKGGYANCTIYAIWNLVTDTLCYVGSTALPMQVRMGLHHKHAYYKRSSALHKHMWEQGLGNFEWRVLQGNIDCDSQQELIKIEESHRVRLNPWCNMRKAYLKNQTTLDRFIKTPHAKPRDG